MYLWFIFYYRNNDLCSQIYWECIRNIVSNLIIPLVFNTWNKLENGQIEPTIKPNTSSEDVTKFKANYRHLGLKHKQCICDHRKCPHKHGGKSKKEIIELKDFDLNEKFVFE